jgi:predicted MFS family arabinose efflux permease
MSASTKRDRAPVIDAGASTVSPRGGARWALLFGNFVIACGVMAAQGTLNDLARSLGVSIALAGQLIAIAAAVMCFGAPLLAGWAAGFDRRKLLAGALLWYAAGHALSALMPSYAALMPVRAATMLGAALFTPQAAAAAGVMAAPQHRARDIAFIFMGWSMASVLGVPLTAWVGEAFGWRTAFACIALLAACGAAWVMLALPDGVRPAAMTLKAWRGVLTNPALMAIVLVTGLHSTGQFTLFSYVAPYYKLQLGASPAEIALLFMGFGAFGLAGSLLMTRTIERIGVAAAVLVSLGLIATSLLLWPLGTSIAWMLLVLAPWGLGCFASNSAQQARLNAAAPAVAPALMALNTSAMYLGQAGGAASGGWLVAQHGFAALHWVAAAWVIAAMALSVWIERERLRAVSA